MGDAKGKTTAPIQSGVRRLPARRQRYRRININAGWRYTNRLSRRFPWTAGVLAGILVGKPEITQAPAEVQLQVAVFARAPAVETW